MDTVSVKVTLINGAVQEFNDCWLMETGRNDYVLSLRDDRKIHFPMSAVLFVEEQMGWR